MISNGDRKKLEALGNYLEPEISNLTWFGEPWTEIMIETSERLEQMLDPDKYKKILEQEIAELEEEGKHEETKELKKIMKKDSDALGYNVLEYTMLKIWRNDLGLEKCSDKEVLKAAWDGINEFKKNLGNTIHWNFGNVNEWNKFFYKITTPNDKVDSLLQLAYYTIILHAFDLFF